MSVEVLAGDGVSLEVDYVEATIMSDEGRDVLAQYGVTVAEGQVELKMAKQVTLVGLGPLGPVMLTALLVEIQKWLGEKGQEMRMMGVGSGTGH